MSIVTSVNPLMIDSKRRFKLNVLADEINNGKLPTVEFGKGTQGAKGWDSSTNIKLWMHCYLVELDPKLEKGSFCRIGPSLDDIEKQRKNHHHIIISNSSRKKQRDRISSRHNLRKDVLIAQKTKRERDQNHRRVARTGFPSDLNLRPRNLVSWSKHRVRM